MELAGKVSFKYRETISVKENNLRTGLMAAKEEQDRVLPPSLHYIRHMNETQLKYNMDNDEATLPSDTPFRVVLCMTPENSKRLLHAQYVQCDIGFKRIAGFQEFELGGLEPVSRTGMY